MSEAEEQLEMLLSVIPPEEATLFLLKFLFKQLAEIQVTVDMMIPVLGAIGSRVGLSDDQLATLARMGATE